MDVVHEVARHSREAMANLTQTRRICASDRRSRRERRPMQARQILGHDVLLNLGVSISEAAREPRVTCPLHCILAGHSPLIPDNPQLLKMSK